MSADDAFEEKLVGGLSQEANHLLDAVERRRSQSDVVGEAKEMNAVVKHEEELELENAGFGLVAGEMLVLIAFVIIIIFLKIILLLLFKQLPREFSKCRVRKAKIILATF